MSSPRSSIIDAATPGKSMTRLFSDDTDVFVLLVCWVYRGGGDGVQGADGAVGYDNAGP